MKSIILESFLVSFFLSAVFCRSVERENLIPLPVCFSNSFLSTLIDSGSIEQIFDDQLENEESKLFSPQNLVVRWDKSDLRKFTQVQLRPDGMNAPLLARAATKLSEFILDKLSCQRNRTSTSTVDQFLKQIRIPAHWCPFDEKASCVGLTSYRTLSGVCNNLQRPYEGSAATAFGRLLPAAYEDGLSQPRSLSVLGGSLPSCRHVSVSLESKPFYDIAINHHWVIYGQLIAYDITESISVSESGRKPRTPCYCNSKDTEFCNIIPIPSDDPFLAPQKCIELSATAQTFTNPTCSLGVKQQINGESHFIDLSLIYGTDDVVASDIRTGVDGLMKINRIPSMKYEFPPFERNSTTCSDANETQKCLAAGDPRMMQTIVLSGLQTQWLRIHNRFAQNLAEIRPDWRGNDEMLYQETRKILIALHQHYTYNYWLPILIGEENAKLYTGDESSFSQYDPSLPAVALNEFVSGVFRLHTFIRDTMTRCRPNGEFIDQRPLVEVVHKCKHAYDVENNGIDSFLCGALHDYSYAGDTHYASEMHHRLFEKKDEKGRMHRKDILSINICRAREHGIPSYNAYREYCGMERARTFEQFTDVMTVESVERLKSIYADPEDVDLLIGANFEKWHRDAVVGPVSVCLIGEQFRTLKYADRFFYTHEKQFTSKQLESIRNYKPQCFFCQTTDIDQVQQNPFRPPDKKKNPTDSCSECRPFDFSPWRL